MPTEDRWNERNGSPRRMHDEPDPTIRRERPPGTGAPAARSPGQYAPDPRAGAGRGGEVPVNDDRDRYQAGLEQAPERWDGRGPDPRRGELPEEYAEPEARAPDSRDDDWRATQPVDSEWSRSSSGAAPRGGFAGRGPKGYTRSDQRVLEDVCERLSADPGVDASEVNVTVHDGEVTLEGSVPDRASKHRAEDIAASVSGAREVTNHLRARRGLLGELGRKLGPQTD